MMGVTEHWTFNVWGVYWWGVFMSILLVLVDRVSFCV